MVTQPRGGREHESKCPSSPDDGADEEAVEGCATVLVLGCVVVGGPRGAFVLGSQASPTPLWLGSVWSWSAMGGKCLKLTTIR